MNSIPKYCFLPQPATVTHWSWESSYGSGRQMGRTNLYLLLKSVRVMLLNYQEIRLYLILSKRVSITFLAYTLIEKNELESPIPVWLYHLEEMPKFHLHNNPCVSPIIINGNLISSKRVWILWRLKPTK